MVLRNNHLQYLELLDCIYSYHHHAPSLIITLILKAAMKRTASPHHWKTLPLSKANSQLQTFPQPMSYLVQQHGIKQQAMGPHLETKTPPHITPLLLGARWTAADWSHPLQTTKWPLKASLPGIYHLGSTLCKSVTQHRCSLRKKCLLRAHGHKQWQGEIKINAIHQRLFFPT